MQPVYSRKFIRGTVSQSSPLTVLVPEGHTYVVKHISAYCGGPAFAVRVWFRSPDDGTALWYAEWSTTERMGKYYDGGFVFEQGERFQFELDTEGGDSANVYAGGFDLINAP